MEFDLPWLKLLSCDKTGFRNRPTRAVKQSVGNRPDSRNQSACFDTLRTAVV